MLFLLRKKTAVVTGPNVHTDRMVIWREEVRAWKHRRSHSVKASPAIAPAYQITSEVRPLQAVPEKI